MNLAAFLRIIFLVFAVSFLYPESRRICIFPRSAFRYSVFINPPHDAVSIRIKVFEPEAVSSWIDALEIHAEAGIALRSQLLRQQAQQDLV